MRRGGAVGIDSEEILAGVERALRSQTFARSDRLRGFIRFTVDRTLAGRPDRVKERTIALEVCGRDPARYNPKANPVVRTEARHLRAKLERYYAMEGHGDALILAYPRGSYLPTFSRRAMAVVSRSEVQPGEETRHGPKPLTVQAPVTTGLRETAPRIGVLPFEDLIVHALYSPTPTRSKLMEWADDLLQRWWEP